MPDPFTPSPGRLPMLASGQPYLPAAYSLPNGLDRGTAMAGSPRVLLLEIAGAGIPARRMGMVELAQIITQFPHMQRVIITGRGDPLLNEDLPDIIGLLKLRDTFVAVDLDGARLTPAWQAELVRARADELRVSLGSVSGGGAERVVEGLRGLEAARSRAQSRGVPQLVLRCPTRRGTISQLPALIRLAARMRADEVYVERYAYSPAGADGHAVFGGDSAGLDELLSECEALSVQLGIALRAAGGRDPRNSLAAARPAADKPWQACQRPWRAVYVTLEGNCCPCRTALEVAPEDPGIVMGNLSRKPLAEIWNGPAYAAFRGALLSAKPHAACEGCGVKWSL
jgi:MoaA/NifB/PqqE/SkfB family radical SAM enzyme